ncbi:MAG: hypothetical protein R2707_01130 [Acidimicrobiales bacterium]
MATEHDSDTGTGASRASKVVLRPAAAAELVDLLADAPGTADEGLLDDARDALEDRMAKVPGPQQRAIGAGKLVALQIDDGEAAAAIELIEHEKVVDGRTLQRLADRLRARVRRARRRRRSR